MGCIDYGNGKSMTIKSKIFVDPSELTIKGMDVDGVPTMIYDKRSFFYLDGLFKEYFGIKKVIFNPPATIVIWNLDNENEKTIVKCKPGETYDPEKGLAMCFMKRFASKTGSYRKLLDKANEWLDENRKEKIIEKIMDDIRSSAH